MILLGLFFPIDAVLDYLIPGIFTSDG